MSECIRECNPICCDQKSSMAYQQGKADKYNEIVDSCLLLTEQQVKELEDEAVKSFVDKLMDNAEQLNLTEWHKVKGIVQKTLSEYKKEIAND